MNGAPLAVIGLGYVGLPLAAAFAEHYDVVGFDVDGERLRELREGFDATRELDAQQLRAARRLRFAHDEAELAGCGIFIVAVPTPVDGVNRPDLRALLAATRTVARVMRPGALVVYESTVFPGCTEEVCVPVLETVSGLRYNADFTCGYSPERANPGDKVHTLRTLRKVTSGSTPEAAAAVDALYAGIVEAGTHRAPSIRVAEAAKVVENAQRDLNIALVNELSLILERLGIDTMEVLEAAASKWNFVPYRPGMVGGHCIGVDPYYLTHKAEEVGYHPQVILAGRRINDDMALHAARGVVRRMLARGMDVPRCTIGVLGITFKENCPDVRNSKPVELVRELQRWGAKVVVADPWADAARLEHEEGIVLGRIDEREPVDALVVAVGHAEYRQLAPADVARLCKPQGVVADLKSLYDRHALGALGLTVFRL